MIPLLNRRKIMVCVLIFLLIVSAVSVAFLYYPETISDDLFVSDVDTSYNEQQITGSMYENQYGRLEVYPDVSTGIITQVQYCNLTSYIDDTEIDVTFRFDISIGNPDIWMWRNISHWLPVPDYGMVNGNYTLVNISDIEVIDEPEFVDLGDIPSDFYRQGTASYWDGIEWWNDTFIIGFDSFEWLDPEHTSAKFYYEYYGVTGYHYEEQYWFDWDNIKDLFNHVEHDGKHYYYVRNWMIKDKLYRFKWQYDTPLVNGRSSGKWDLLAKKSTDPLGTWRVSIDPWWDSDWGYSKTCEVANKIDEYQMKITIDYDAAQDGSNVSCEGHCQVDFDDVRFVYNNATELPYWIENYTASSQATFWVNNSGNYSSFEMFYGNADVGNNSNGDTTFDFFDDFNDNSLDATKWPYNKDNHFVEQNQRLEYTSDADDYIRSSFVTNNEKPSVIEYDIYVNHASTSRHHICCWHWNVPVNPQVRGNGFLIYLRDDDPVADQYKVYKCVDGGYTEFTAADPYWLVQTWNHIVFEIRGDTNFYSVFAGDVAKPMSLTDGSYTSGYFAIETGSSGADMYYDTVYIHKYASLPPSWSSFGSEQEAPPPTVPVNSNPSPANDETNVVLSISNFSIYVSDPNGDTMNVTFRTNESSNWLDAQTNSSVSNGTYYLTNKSWVDLYTTQYWWSVNTSDGNGNWDNDTYSFTTRGGWDYDQPIAWAIINDTGVTILKLSVSGNLAIAGELWENTNSPPAGANIVANMNNSWWIDINGTLYIMGGFFYILEAGETTYVCDAIDAQAYEGGDSDGGFDDDDGEFTSGDYTSVSVNDSNSVKDVNSVTGEYQYHRFDFTIDENVDYITQIDITWKGTGGSQNGFAAAHQELWVNESGTWTFKTEDVSTGVNILTVQKTSAFDEWISDSHLHVGVQSGIATNGQDSFVSSYYVEVKVTYSGGYIEC